MMKNTNIDAKQVANSGYTIVEMAVVILIISITLATILQADKIIENARVIRMIKSIENYRSATETFVSFYRQLPGDLTDAHKKIPNCHPKACNTEFLQAYAGDWTIGMPDWDFLVFQSYNINGDFPKTQNDYFGYYAETVLYWYELEQAGYLHGEITDRGVADYGASNTIEFGESLPRAPFGGGFWVGNSNGEDPDNVLLGRPSDAVSGDYKYPYPQMGTVIITVSQIDPVDYYTRVTKKFSEAQAALVFVSKNIQPLKPNVAAQIDRKLDDGTPMYGKIQAYGVPKSCYKNINGSYIYNDSIDTNDCGLIISIAK